MGRYADYLRWLYKSGRPNRFAKLQNRASAAVYAADIWPRRAAALDVRGRKNGRVITFPIVIAEYNGERYLVSMLGDDDVAPGARPHIPIDRRAPLREFEQIAPRIPVFRITARP